MKKSLLLHTYSTLVFGHVLYTCTWTLSFWFAGPTFTDKLFRRAAKSIVTQSYKTIEKYFVQTIKQLVFESYRKSNSLLWSLKSCLIEINTRQEVFAFCTAKFWPFLQATNGELLLYIKDQLILVSTFCWITKQRWNNQQLAVVCINWSFSRIFER